jgi:hypothetical protein
MGETKNGNNIDSYIVIIINYDWNKKKYAIDLKKSKDFSEK